MRIVFASLGSLGDLHPLLALARGAHARGHEPVIAASVGFRDYVEGLGFTFRKIRPDLDPESARMEYLSHPTKGPERLLREELFPKVRETYADLLEAAKDADVLVVGELLYVAPLVAHSRKIPWANVILSPSSFLSACDPCVLAPAPALHRLRGLGTWPYRLVFSLGRLLTSRWGAPLLALREELGLSPGPSPVFEGKHSPDLVLACFPSFLAAPQSDWPQAVVQTGFPFFSQPSRPEIADRLTRFLADGDPPIVFTLGSTAVHIARDFYNCAIASARKLGLRAVLLAGKNQPLTPSASDALIIDYAPLPAVLAGAAAVVHHGGIGTCAEALRAGVPSLIIPFGYDQPDNAERLRRLGAATVLARARFSQARLTTGLEDLLASHTAQCRASELAAEIHPKRDMDQTLNTIEKLGRRTSRSLPAFVQMR